MQQTLLDENQPRPAHIGVSAQPTRGGWALVIGGDARSGWLARRCARLHDDHDDLRDLDCGLYPVFDRLHGCGDVPLDMRVPLPRIPSRQVRPFGSNVRTKLLYVLVEVTRTRLECARHVALSTYHD
jgi:hypothetical protein